METFVAWLLGVPAGVLIVLYTSIIYLLSAKRRACNVQERDLHGVVNFRRALAHNASVRSEAFAYRSTAGKSGIRERAA